MLINLYGHIVNPKSIIVVEIATGGESYLLRLPTEVGTSTTGQNWIEISTETVQTVDDLTFHQPDKLYMMNIINKLERLAKTSAEGVNTNGRTQGTV
jgi:hypothetical protein